jgi:hypothetical protein
MNGASQALLTAAQSPYHSFLPLPEDGIARNNFHFFSEEAPQFIISLPHSMNRLLVSGLFQR